MVWDLRDKASFDEVEEIDCFKQTTNMIRREGVVICYRYGLDIPCSCTECVQQFRSFQSQKIKTFGYRYGLSDLEAFVLAAETTRSISQDWQYLKQQCDLNGNSILKRWKKKSKAERSRVLQQVMPDICPHQWPDASIAAEFCLVVQAECARNGGLVDSNTTLGLHKRQYRDRILLPYVNLEALSNDPMRLLNLLYTRTKYTPEEWASYDNSLLDAHWRQGSLDLTYNQGCIVMRGPNYGSWTTWRKEQAHDWSIIGFPRAILILETQERLLRFLRGAVKHLLAGLIREDRIAQSNHFVEALERGPQKMRFGPVQSRQFQSPYLNQPFSAPPVFDIDILLLIAQTRLNMHADHLCLLQTEPSFLRRYAEVVVAGGLREHLTSHNRQVWTSNYIMQDLTWYWSWEWITEQLEQVQREALRIRDSLGFGKAVSQRYEDVLACTAALLLEQFKRRARFIHALLPMRSGFKNIWELKYRQIKQTVQIERQMKERQYQTAESFNKDRLYFCISVVTLDRERNLEDNGKGALTRGTEFEPANAFAMLDDHLAECAKAGKKDELARTDKVLYDTLTDLSAVHQLLSMIRLRNPPVKQIDLEQAASIGSGKAWRYVSRHFMEQTPFRRADEVVRNRESAENKIAAEQRLGKLLSNFLSTETPKGRPYTQQWADQNTAQRKSLGVFWQAMRERHAQTLRRLGFDSEDITSDIEILSADSKPDHLEYLEVEKERIQTALQTSAAVKNINKPSKADLQTQWGECNDLKTQIPEEKVKLKTRGNESSNTDISLGNSQVTDPEPEPVVQAVVSKKALAVFKVMFPTDNLEDRSKSVDWDAFVNAMGEEEVGFVARHSAGGAAYTFEPCETSKWAGQGKIVFHKPHPTPVLDSIMMSINGKRMKKWFGWSCESFVLKM